MMERFGSVVLTERIPGRGKQRWNTRCDCGKSKVFRLDDLRNRVKQKLHPSCGCMYSEVRSEISLRAFDTSRYLLKKFGQLLVTGSTIVETKQGTKSRLVCMCDCGAQIVVRADQITRGVTKSCGHIQREFAAELGKSMLEHGHTVHGELSSGISPVYQVWSTIKKCVSKGWKRGAHRVCHEYDQRWEDFANFYADFGDIKASEGISRIDNKKPWAKDNCFVHVTGKRSVRR